LYLSHAQRKDRVYTGSAAQEIFDVFDKQQTEGLTEIRGRQAHGMGQVIKGRVRIVRRHYGESTTTQAQINAMQMGEILVSDTTDPELMGAFRKAAAVVTDAGGLLSHAAITSRELNLPCIVGTGNASKSSNWRLGGS